jgi:hypothetical protein
MSGYVKTYLIIVLMVILLAFILIIAPCTDGFFMGACNLGRVIVIGFFSLILVIFSLSTLIFRKLAKNKRISIKWWTPILILLLSLLLVVLIVFFLVYSNRLFK